MSQSGVPYLGSKISLISKSEIRYEGILYTIDTKESTVALARVVSFGTEDRPTERPVAPRDHVYEYIIFRAADIKDLHVCEAPKQATNIMGLPNDPAIVQHSAPVATLPSVPYSPSSSVGSYGPIGAISYNAPPVGLPSIPQPFITPGSQHSDSRSETPTHTPQLQKSPPLESSIPLAAVGSSRMESKENKPPGSASQQRMGGGKVGSQSQAGPSNQSQRKGPPSSGQRVQQQQQQPHHHHHHQQQQHHQRSPQRNDYYSGGQRRGNRGQGRSRQNYSGRTKVLQFEGEYDFEQANAQFQELEGKLAKIKLEDSPTSNSIPEPEEKKEEASWQDNGDVPTPDEDDSAVFYDRAKSFFDNISCEAVERSKGNIHRHDWRQERKLNVETFGVSGSSSWRRNAWRGRGGGGGSYRSRGYRGGGGGRGMGYRSIQRGGDRNGPHSSMNR